MRRFAGLLCLLALSVTARAEVRRLALFVGIDQGLEDEARLHFAARDAKGMEALFRQTGLYRSEDIVLLANPDLDAVRKAMDRLAADAARLKSQGSPVQLFVYFSGHGDSKSLHIRGRKLMRDDLVAWLNKLPSELKIVVLDACESGDFLRSKGGRFLQDLPVRNDENLKSHGVVIVTSTSRGEVAQESDEYEGAVFTHHLENGLRGLADYSGDGWVSLQESFEYARRATAMDAALEGSLQQNPSFDLDLVGGSDPGLVPLDRGKSWVRFRHFPAGKLEIFDANSLDRIARVWLTGSDSLDYRIPGGSYLFRFREGGRDWLYTSSVARTGGATVDRKEFRERVAGTWTSKGGYAVRLQGIESALGAPHPFPSASMGMGRLAWVQRTAAHKTAVSLGIGRGFASDDATALSTRLDIYQLAARRTWFLAGTRRLHFLAGGMAGWDWVRQTVRDGRFGGRPIPLAAGTGPVETTSWFDMAQAGVPTELEWNAYRALWLIGELDYTVYAYRDNGSKSWRARLEMEPFVQVGLHF
jgi:hypothetical protein